MARPLSRRALLSRTLVAFAAGPTMAMFGEVARADDLSPLSPDDSNAKALKFVPDTAAIDAHADPTYQPGQRCAGCIHFKGKRTDKVAACETFPGHSVPATGWCMVWSARFS